MTGLLDVLIGLAVDDLLALIANGMVGGLVGSDTKVVEKSFPPLERVSKYFT